MAAVLRWARGGNTFATVADRQLSREPMIDNGMKAYHKDAVAAGIAVAEVSALGSSTPRPFRREPTRHGRSDGRSIGRDCLSEWRAS